MKTIYDMTSGTLRKEIEDQTCNIQAPSPLVRGQTADTALLLQEYVFETATAQARSDHDWLAGLDIEQFFNDLK